MSRKKGNDGDDKFVFEDHYSGKLYLVVSGISGRYYVPLEIAAMLVHGCWRERDVAVAPIISLATSPQSLPALEVRTAVEENLLKRLSEQDRGKPLTVEFIYYGKKYVLLREYARKIVSGEETSERIFVVKINSSRRNPVVRKLPRQVVLSRIKSLI